jgi:hypothetical protein
MTKRYRDKAQLTFRFIPQSGAARVVRAHNIVRKAILEACLELADATRCGVVPLSVKRAIPSDLITNARGKRPLLVEIPA